MANDKYLPSRFQINFDRALEIGAGALEVVFEIEQRSAQICAAIGHRDRHA
jgi:hypothetical protein